VCLFEFSTCVWLKQPFVCFSFCLHPNSMLFFSFIECFATRVMNLYMNMSVEICLDLLCIIDFQTANGLHMVNSSRLVLEMEVVFIFFNWLSFSQTEISFWIFRHLDDFASSVDSLSTFLHLILFIYIMHCSAFNVLFKLSLLVLLFLSSYLDMC
jgi:hypothetical protein